jgi:hypothetical protein
MPLLYEDERLNPPHLDGSSRAVKAAARWDSHRKVVIVRGVDGFIYYRSNIPSRPSPDELAAIHNMASVGWNGWCLEQLRKQSNRTHGSTAIH